MQSAISCFAGRDWGRVAGWAMLSLVLNLAWEIAHFPLYRIAGVDSAFVVAYSILHCALGDAFIASGSFILAMFLLRDSAWPAARPLMGAAIAVPFGVAYTVWSEWFNVYRAGNWGYTEDMPLLFGIGLSPFVQWLVVPVVTIVVWSALARRMTARRIS